MFTQANSLLLQNTPSNLGLVLYAKLFDSSGVQVGEDITDSFVETGLGNYTLTYEGFPDYFTGTLAFYNSVGDVFLASTDINHPVTPLVFSGGDVQREKDIVIYRGNTTMFSWANSTFNNPDEILFIIKFDMVDPVEDAMLVASLTNGAEVVNGEPYNFGSDAIITFDDNFVYCTLEARLTALYSSVTGTQQYDVTNTDGVNGVRTIAYGNVSVILSGAQ